MRREAILVLGMHRSGTSALTGMLKLLGAEVGTHLMSPDPESNPKGFLENQDIVDIHDLVLEHLGSSWHDDRDLTAHWWQQPEMESFRQDLVAIIRRDYGEAPLWVVKDPRMCRLLPLWAPLLEEMVDETKVVLIVRHPQEVAESLERRDGISCERAYMIWLRSVLEAEQWSREYPRILVSYEQLLSSWRSVAESISKKLSLPFSYESASLQKEITAFLDLGLRHHVASHELDGGNLSKLAESVYHTLLETQDLSRLRTAISSFGKEFSGRSKQSWPWSSEIQSLWSEKMYLRDTLEACKAQSVGFETEIARMKSTFSWQITKPARLMANLPRFLREKMRAR